MLERTISPYISQTAEHLNAELLTLNEELTNWNRYIQWKGSSSKRNYWRHQTAEKTAVKTITIYAGYTVECELIHAADMPCALIRERYVRSQPKTFLC